jgi:hypothetical protein
VVAGRIRLVKSNAHATTPRRRRDAGDSREVARRSAQTAKATAANTGTMNANLLGVRNASKNGNARSKADGSTSRGRPAPSTIV